MIFLLSFVIGANIQITPDSSLKIDQKDIAAMKSFVKKKYHFIMNEKGAKKIVKENRLLSDAYLKHNLLSDFEKRMIRIEIEKKLADNYVSYLQKKKSFPEKVLKSYYYDHIEEFKKPDEVKLILYKFSKYDDALHFLQNPKNVTSYSKQNLGWKYIKGIKNPYRQFIKSGKKGYYTPVFVMGKNRYDIFYVEDYRDNKNNYFPYKDVRSQIERIFLNKTFEREREKILRQYQ